MASFTPVLSFGGSSTGITYSNAIGEYDTTGNVFTYRCTIQLSNKGSSTGNAVISGFPVTFPNIGDAQMTVGAHMNLNFSTNFDTVAAYTTGSGSADSLTLLQCGGGQVIATLTDANFTNGTYLWFSGSFLLI